MKYETILNSERPIVNKRIEELLLDSNFEFSLDYLMRIHKYLFKGIVPFAGKFRECNLIKKEKILNDCSVTYADYKRILLYLSYDFENEKENNYQELTTSNAINNIANFTSRIWITHPFRDGNTRTVSVFIQKYLNSLGYNVNNTLFKENGEYFRNALVISGYFNHELCIHRNLAPLIAFFEKLLTDENIDLDNDNLYVKDLFYKSSTNHTKVLKK